MDKSTFDCGSVKILLTSLHEPYYLYMLEGLKGGDGYMGQLILQHVLLRHKISFQNHKDAVVK